MNAIAWVLLCGYAGMSVVTLVAYGLDKRRAERRQWRIAEWKLHVFELLGGWPGGLAGQAIFHHKNRKLSYTAVFVAIILLHVMLWAVWGRWVNPGGI